MPSPLKIKQKKRCFSIDSGICTQFREELTDINDLISYNSENMSISFSQIILKPRYFP